MIVESYQTDHFLLQNGEVILFQALEAASRKVEDLTISEWADRYRIVSPESGSPWPGPFKTSRVPYLREPQDCLHPDHPARRVTARLAAQLGKSTVIENWFCYTVDRAPCSMMIVLPTLEESVKFNRIKLAPTIEATPRISHKVLPVNSRDEQGSTTAFKRFAGGFCQIVNAGSSKGLQMVSIKNLAMDESTGYPQDVDGRGSPRDQARARQKAYGDFAKEWQGSTPGIAGECAISYDFEVGDQRYYYVPCPHCGGYQALDFANMNAPDEQHNTAYFRCIGCGQEIMDAHKNKMLEMGKWIARHVPEGRPPIPNFISGEAIDRYICPPCEGRCHAYQPSYHLWAAYAPRERWTDIWTRWIEAQKNTQKMRVFYQQDLALPYDPGGEAIEWEKVVNAASRTDMPSHIVPSNAGLVVSAADVQGYGIKWAVYAIGPYGQRWLIDREVFEGAPEQTDEPWIQLADALQRQYPTSGDKLKSIDLSGVDSGFATNRVYRFCATRPNVFALDGRAQKGLPWLGTPKKRDIRDKHKGLISKALLYPVGNYDVKTELVAGIANFVAGPDNKGIWPANTFHLPADLCDEEFAKEITAERLVDPDEEARASINRRARNFISSKAERTWKKIIGRKNDWFDTSVYAFALGWYLEHKNRLTNDRWRDLIIDVHGKSATPDLFAKIAKNPFSRKQQTKDRKRKSLAEISAALNR